MLKGQIFGVDLLCSFPTSEAASAAGQGGELELPTITLLEWNASPDFHQSGDRLSGSLLEMFEGTIRLAVAPFFGLETTQHHVPGHSAEKDAGTAPANPPTAEPGMKLGESKWGWTLVGGSEVRRFD